MKDEAKLEIQFKILLLEKRIKELYKRHSKINNIKKLNAIKLEIDMYSEMIETLEYQLKFNLQDYTLPLTTTTYIPNIMVSGVYSFYI